MRMWIPSFTDELEKISRLTDEEERRQALQFAGLGAIATPVISGVTNLITHGKVSPWGSFRRWLPAQMVAGTLAGGALPTMRHMLERSNLRSSQARQELQKQLSEERSAGTISKLPKVING